MSGIMLQQPNRPGRQGFPLRLFAAAFVISLLATVFSGWQAWQMHERFQELSDKRAHVTGDIGRIMLFDEALTMSARMAAATGERAYEKRYDQFDAQLTAVINHVRADLPQLEIEPFIRETDEANLALIKMERQAFALTHQGRRQEALALLASDEYLRLKKVYAGGMEQAAAAMMRVLEREQQHLHYLNDLAAAANAAGILVLLAAWFFAARSARSWDAERGEAEEALRKSRDGLEARVEQRTADLLGTNEQLQREVAERKQAGTLLDAQHADTRIARLEWQAVFDSITHPVFLHDSEFRITRANMAYAKAAGMDIHDVIGQPYWKIFPRSDGPMDSCLHSRHSHKTESEEFSADGENYLSLAFLTDKFPGEQYGVHIIENITERKRADEALSQRENQFRKLFENSNDAIFIHTLDGRILDANSQAANMTGYPLAVLRTLPVSALHPEEELEASKKALKETISKGSTRFESHFLQPSGALIDVEISASIVDSKKGIIQGVVRDITERKQHENKTQQLLREATQSRLSMLSMIEDQRQSWEEIRKLNDELEAKVLARTADLEHARLEAEQANRAKSAFLATMSHEIRTPMNGVIGMLDVLQQSSLKGTQIEMANIIHDSAHALLTIIDDILDFSKIEAGKFQIDSIPTNIAKVVEGVCETLARVAEKKEVELTLFTDPAIPAEVLGDPARLRQTLINLAGNAIKFCSGHGRQGKVSVRAVLVEGTSDGQNRFPLPNPLVETTSHSAKLQETAAKPLVTPQAGEGARIPSPQSSPANGRGGEREEQFSISESLRDVNQILLEFRILDNGIGIDKEAQARLFTPFTQADASTTRSFGGTGLGLSISRQLTNLMGGEIAVQSEPGKGSLFSVRIPFKLLPGCPFPLQGGGDTGVAGLTCLVVGDSKSLADDLAAYLAHAGAVVERVPNASSAQKWIAEQRMGSHLPGLCVVVIDANGPPPPLGELRAAVRKQPGLDGRFVVVGRGNRSRGRVEEIDLVALDANGMHRSRFLEAVAIAAGRAKEYDAKDQAGDIKPAARPLSREDAIRQGCLILVAEDNEINQKVILQQLALLGKTADIANNGSEALELWQSGDYGILITDLHMPEMDGYELTAAIRAAEGGKSHIPVIAFSANALKGEAEHCLAAGMDDYLSKPVQVANLKAMLGKWLPVVGNLKSEPPDVGAPVAVDVNVLKKLVGDDEEVIRDFLYDFRLGAEKTAAELRVACAAEKAAAAGALAHKLKSSARAVGALALGERCAEMEKSGKAGDVAALEVLLPRFEQELAGVKDFLEGY